MPRTRSRRNPRSLFTRFNEKLDSPCVATLPAPAKAAVLQIVAKRLVVEIEARVAVGIDDVLLFGRDGRRR